MESANCQRNLETVKFCRIHLKMRDPLTLPIFANVRTKITLQVFSRGIHGNFVSWIYLRFGPCSKTSGIHEHSNCAPFQFKVWPPKVIINIKSYFYNRCQCEVVKNDHNFSMQVVTKKFFDSIILRGGTKSHTDSKTQRPILIQILMLVSYNCLIYDLPGLRLCRKWWVWPLYWIHRPRLPCYGSWVPEPTSFCSSWGALKPHFIKLHVVFKSKHFSVIFQITHNFLEL